MSLAPLSTKRSLVTGGAIALGVCGTAVVGLAVMPVSGAYFFDTKNGYVQIDTASLGLQVSSTHGTNPDRSFNLVLNTMFPGYIGASRFTATNTGTAEGRLRLTTNNFSLTGGQNPDLSLLSVVVGSAGNVALQNNGTQLDLGLLRPGESRDFDVYSVLSPDAGNEWQNVRITDTFKLMLEQYSR